CALPIPRPQGSRARRTGAGLSSAGPMGNRLSCAGDGHQGIRAPPRGSSDCPRLSRAGTNTIWRVNMGKFVIQPHGRLQEWIADAKGYFREEGLDYEFRHGLAMESAKRLNADGTVAEVHSGAFESYQRAAGNKGVRSDISCACHWAVNQAAAQQIGTMWRK